jgi:hypothetical protein
MTWDPKVGLGLVLPVVTGVTFLFCPLGHGCLSVRQGMQAKRQNKHPPCLVVACFLLSLWVSLVQIRGIFGAEFPYSRIGGTEHNGSNDWVVLWQIGIWLEGRRKKHSFHCPNGPDTELSVFMHYLTKSSLWLCKVSIIVTILPTMKARLKDISNFLTQKILTSHKNFK